MAVQIIDNFQLNKPMPLDSRVVLQSLSDLPIKYCYDGMLVYQKSNQKYYKFVSGSFYEFAGTSGISEFNGRTGSITIIKGTGINIEEVSPGEFRIETLGVILSNGSVQMDANYVPTKPKDVATKDFVEQRAADAVVTVDTTLITDEHITEHVAIDNRSIQKDSEGELFVAVTDGGQF